MDDSIFMEGHLGSTGKSAVLLLCKKILYVKALCLAEELAPSILELSVVDKEKNLCEINDEIDKMSNLDQLKTWNETSFYANLETLLRNFYSGRRKDNPNGELQPKADYFTKMLLDTKDLELVYVKSKKAEPCDLSVMCDYGKAEMFSDSNWLSDGNRLGKILMKIRDELRKEESHGKE